MKYDMHIIQEQYKSFLINVSKHFYSMRMVISCSKILPVIYTNMEKNFFVPVLISCFKLVPVFHALAKRHLINSNGVLETFRRTDE